MKQTSDNLEAVSLATPLAVEDTASCFIPLSRGLFAKVSSEDYATLSQYKWYAWPWPGGRHFYAFRSVTIGKYKERTERMHRVVANAPDGMHVDHINGDPLDNRRSNLRIANQSQNLANRSCQVNNTSGFKGVFKNRASRIKPWRAKIEVRGRTIFAGYFQTPEEAARAYDAAAIKHFGPFARLNFPEATS